MLAFFRLQTEKLTCDNRQQDSSTDSQDTHSGPTHRRTGNSGKAHWSVDKGLSRCLMSHLDAPSGCRTELQGHNPHMSSRSSGGPEMLCHGLGIQSEQCSPMLPAGVRSLWGCHRESTNQQNEPRALVQLWLSLFGVWEGVSFLPS